MAYEFKFPDVGEGITEGKLIKWTVNVGDDVKEDQIVAEVETDKAVVEIPTPHSGKVSDLKYNSGDMLEVGQVIMVLDGESSAPTPEPASEEVQEEEPHSKTEPTIVPKPPVNREPTEHEKTLPDEKPIEPKETHPEGVLAMPGVRHVARERGIDLSTIQGTGKHGQVTFEDLEGKQGTTPLPQPVQETPVSQPAVEQSPTPPGSSVAVARLDIIATPSVRQLARELGVDINNVKGSGELGRIFPEDVRAAAKRTTPTEPAPEVQSSTPAPTQVTGDRIPLSGIRGVIAKRMLESQQKTAAVTHTDEANLTKLVKVRAEQKQVLERMGVKLTYLPFFIKAFIGASSEYPILNSIFDEAANEVVLSKDFHIGLAVDTPKGLLVPVIKDAQDKSIVDLAREIIDLAGKGRDGKLSPDEMNGSTFTISSVGSLGGQVFTPIINYPNIAILGIGKIVKKPIVEDGEIVIADTVTFSLTFDHRILDGADAARFLKKYIELIENPELLFMEMN